MYTDWAVFVEDNDKNRGQKYPLKERRVFNPASINLFITICDYDEEKYDEQDAKILALRGMHSATLALDQTRILHYLHGCNIFK